MEPVRIPRHSARTTARKHALLVDGTAAVCPSASDERDGHGSTTRRVRGACGRGTGPPPTVVTRATVEDVALTDDVALDDVAPTGDVACVEADRDDPPQAVRHAHPATAMTAVQRIG